MTEYVPLSAVRRLAARAESDAGLFEDDTPANRLGHKIADDLREAIDKERVTEAEVCADE